METQNLPQSQPIIIKEKGGTSIGTILAWSLGIGATAFFGRKWLIAHKADKEAGKLDTPAAQAASKIESAKHWYGDSPQIAFDAAKEIVQNKVAWSEVSTAFKNLYNTNIDDYLNFLSPEEKAQFFNILNLSAPAKSGQPPAKSSMKYDTVKNSCFAVVTLASNIRKSPEIKSGNIIRTAQIGQALGLMTGEYKLSSDGKSGFVEFYAAAILAPLIGSQVNKGFVRCWVSGANIKVVQFDRATQDQAGKDYMHNTKFLMVDFDTFTNANS